MTIAGIVHEVGLDVVRFKKGDRILTSTAMILRDDWRYGAFQKFSLTKQEMTAHVSTPVANSIYIYIYTICPDYD